MQEIVKEIRDVLSEVKYPGTSKSIVALDMVQNIKAEDGKVDFRLVFQKSNDPFVGTVRKKCESLLKEKLGYTTVEIETVFVHDLEKPLALEKVKHIVAVSSGKGGVGKSTVAWRLPWLNWGIKSGWWMLIFMDLPCRKCSGVRMPVLIW